MTNSRPTGSISASFLLRPQLHLPLCYWVWRLCVPAGYAVIL